MLILWINIILYIYEVTFLFKMENIQPPEAQQIMEQNTGPLRPPWTGNTLAKGRYFLRPPCWFLGDILVHQSDAYKMGPGSIYNGVITPINGLLNEPTVFEPPKILLCCVFQCFFCWP